MREPAEKSRFAEFFGNLDYLQLGAMLLLLTVGLIFIRSTGIQVDTPASRAFFSKQIQWIVMGAILYFLLAAMDYRALPLRFAAFGAYGAILILLIAVLFFGKTVSGATRWLDLGGFRLQPSEPAKLTLILVLAAIFSAPDARKHSFRTAGLALLAAAIPFLLIAAEPDLGSALILLPILAAMAFCFGIRWRYVLVTLLLAALLAGIVLADCFYMGKPRILRSYQVDRIRIFFHPETDIRARGSNAYQAMNSVGSGGLSGHGIGRGVQNELGFLPQTVTNNDFIFSVLAEETGFTGAIFLLLLYALLLYSILRTAFLVSGYGRSLAVGIGVMIFCHIFINIGMNIGIAPITGLPLPFISYGGSFTLTGMATLGLMQSIYRFREADAA